MKITKREIIASISIIAIMLLVGILISGKISEYYIDKNEIYNKAVKIENDKDLFQYGMDTNIGNAFIYGDLKAVDTVSYPEINGEYMYIEKVKEKYTMHTRQVPHTKTVNGKTTTYYTTETYWSWDKIRSENKKSKELSFCNIIFPINKINIPDSKYIDMVKESSHIRYKYYGVATEFKGTVFTELKDKTISDNSNFYKDLKPQEIVENLNNNDTLFIVLFWIGWIVLIAFLVFGFYYLDNKWLE